MSKIPRSYKIVTIVGTVLLLPSCTGTAISAARVVIEDASLVPFLLFLGVSLVAVLMVLSTKILYWWKYL